MRQFTRSETPRSIILDVASNGVLTSEFRIQNLPRSPLRIFSPAPQPTVRSPIPLDSLLEPGSVESVLLGNRYDPFHPFEGKLDSTLKLLEMLALKPPTQIAVQTRSPLAILAVPLFHALGSRLSVTVAFEALDDEENSALTPDLPRPSERLQLVRTLRELGISVTCQLSPIFHARREGELFCSGRMRRFLNEFRGLRLEPLPACWISDRTIPGRDHQTLAVAFRVLRKAIHSMQRDATSLDTETDSLAA